MNAEHLLVTIIIAVSATLFLLPPVVAFLTRDPLSPLNDESLEDES